MKRLIELPSWASVRLCGNIAVVAKHMQGQTDGHQPETPA